MQSFFFSASKSVNDQEDPWGLLSSLYSISLKCKVKDQKGSMSCCGFTALYHNRNRFCGRSGMVITRDTKNVKTGIFFVDICRMNDE